MSARIRIPEPLRALAKLAHRLGWRVTYSGSGHLHWHAPDGTTIVTPSTPGDRRSALNGRARLRRAGLREEQDHA